MHVHRSLVALAATLSVLTLASCTDRGSATDTAAGDRSGTGSAQESPLAPYLDAAYGTGELTDAQMDEERAQFVAFEEKLAECLKKEGFEYTPEEPRDEYFQIGGVADEDFRPDDEEWVSVHGYGIVDLMVTPVGGPAEDAAETSPNTIYYESLSESQKRAFEVARYGKTAEEQEEAAEQGIDPSAETWEDRGCAGWAEHELNFDTQVEPAADLSAFEDLLTRMDEVSKTADQDPEVSALDSGWVSCMQNAGHSGFANPDDAQSSIASEAMDARGAESESETSSGGSEQSDVSEIPEPLSEADIAALRDKEIELALADLSCREETHYAETLAEIVFRVEQEFVDANKEELDAMKRAAEQAG